MLKNIFFSSALLLVVILSTVCLVKRSKETFKGTSSPDYYDGDENYLLDNDFFEDLDYTKDIN